MSFAFFLVPIEDEGGRAAKELNQFLSTHRVVNIQRRLIEQGANSAWTFCVEYSAAAMASNRVGNSTTRNGVDYRSLLPPDEFQWFSQLRDWRTSLAKMESIPPYLIFNNQQLAQIVQERMRTKSDLLRIPNVGSAKVEKYGDSILEQLTMWGGGDATSG
jgi:superfamily II DNA helicase RecQ